MFVTESELRELWQNGRRPLPAFPPGTRFSPAALDFLRAHGLEARFAPEAGTAGSAAPQPSTALARWRALGGLAAAQARAYNLPALAAELEALTGGAPAAPAPAPDHAIVHWLRLLRAEALAAAALARQERGGQAEAAQLEALAAAVEALEARYLAGGLGWRVNP